MTSETHEQAARHDPVYDRLHESSEFTELRRRYRGFVFPATAAFLAWYLLYVCMSNWAGDFMAIKVVGNINVALIFGLLQFVTTFGLAWLYSRFSNAKLDPLARNLEQAYRDQAGTDAKRGQA
ncbi:DUF485 domain-containing protein [Nocardioides terrigena]|uniref:DUF485 domain-containing protein n=1 Tax=Nocardioides terrigena TaxID=424797 RepID=UPI0018FF2704|nr:DUF485 domain-containing protein [Nocardioides terrigena]